MGTSMIEQDLHIHTTYSTGDASVVPEQTISMIAAIEHARVVGISDHFEYLLDGVFTGYERKVRHAGLKVGVEVDGHRWASAAATYDVDYYVYHCLDQDADYLSIDTLLSTGKPVIIAHPNVFLTDLTRVPAECLIEINNRYVWQSDWSSYYRPFVDRFRFVLSSDAHQPNWLGQAVASYVANQLGVKEHVVF